MNKILLVFILIFVTLFGIFYLSPQITQRETKYALPQFALAGWEEALEELPLECKEKLLARSNLLSPRTGDCSVTNLSQFWTPATIRADHWYPDLVQHASKVCFCESGGWHKARSTTGCCHGLFQINTQAHSFQALGISKLEDLHNPVTNIQVAINMYNANPKKWRDWECADAKHLRIIEELKKRGIY